MDITPFELERILDQKLAARACQNLIGRYLHYLTACRTSDMLALWADDPEACVWDKSWYKEAIEVPFEFITIKIPAGYKEYLTKTYGEWQKFVVGSSDHGDIIFDTDRSYKEYL